jgi:hypothetical protein
MMYARNKDTLMLDDVINMPRRQIVADFRVECRVE